ncbi:MAG: SLC13 family permease [Intestinibacillus sp.]
MNFQQILSIVIFLLVIIAIMSERVHRAVAAITGGIILLLCHLLTVETAVSYIDFNTIGVLIGMMLFVAVVKNSGIFEYIAIKAAKVAKGNPWKIMLMFFIITAVLSGFLDNVTTVLLIGPMTLAITRILKINPVPYMIVEIMASNIGGTATLIGDPPNIMIGSAAHLSFISFLDNTGFAVLLIMIATLICFYFIYGRKMTVDSEAMKSVMELDEQKAIKDRPLMHKSIVMILLIAVAFVIHDSLGIESCTIALTGAAIMLLIGKQDAEEIILGVEWSTILFFTGLFVVVGGLVETGVIKMLGNALLGATDGHPIVTMLIILWLSALFSAILDNIPFVATLIPLILTMQSGGMDVEPLWWALSLGACLGGNGTLIGASANVVLSGISGKEGHPISFMHYLKIAFPLMILSIVISTAFLVVKY